MDVADEMKVVEAQIGGRVGEAVSGARREASRLSRAGTVLKSGLRRLASLGAVTLIVGGIVLAGACASPFAVWSAYQSGRAVQTERDRAAGAEAVAKTAKHDKAVIEKASTKLAATDEADRTEIRRLKANAARASHRASAPTCPGTVLDAIHGLSTSRPAAEE